MRLTDVSTKHLRELLAEAERVAGADSASAKTLTREMERRRQRDGRREAVRRRLRAQLEKHGRDSSLRAR